MSNDSETLWLKEKFAKYDADGSGDIDVSELQTLMSEVTGETPTAPEVAGFIEAVDADSDGKLDFEEFVAVMSRKVSATYTADQVKNAFKVFEGDAPDASRAVAGPRPDALVRGPAAAPRRRVLVFVLRRAPHLDPFHELVEVQRPVQVDVEGLEEVHALLRRQVDAPGPHEFQEFPRRDGPGAVRVQAQEHRAAVQQCLCNKSSRRVDLPQRRRLLEDRAPTDSARSTTARRDDRAAYSTAPTRKTKKW